MTAPIQPPPNSYRDLKITPCPIEDIKAPPRLTRKHTRKQIRQLEASLKTFWILKPIMVDAANIVNAGTGGDSQAQHGDAKSGTS